MISKEDKTLIYEQRNSLAYHVFHAPINFQNIKAEVDILDDLLFNTKGIRDDIKSSLQLILRNIKTAASKKDIFNTMDVCDELTILLQLNLHIKFESQDIKTRSLAHLRARGLEN